MRTQLGIIESGLAVIMLITALAIYILAAASII